MKKVKKELVAMVIKDLSLGHFYGKMK